MTKMKIGFNKSRFQCLKQNHVWRTIKGKRADRIKWLDIIPLNWFQEKFQNHYDAVCFHCGKFKSDV